MKALLLPLDEPALRALNRIAPAAKRQRAEFVRALGHALAWDELTVAD